VAEISAQIPADLADERQSARAVPLAIDGIDHHDHEGDRT